MKQTKINIEIQFTEPLLGTASNNPDVHEEFIAKKAPNHESAKEEIDAIPVDPEQEFEKALTVFPRDDKGLHIWDYQIRGFFKEAIGVLIELGDIPSTRLTKWGHKKAVDSVVFVNPRKIYLFNDQGQHITSAKHFTRPLRAQTMQGERVALATSDELPPGTLIRFEVLLLEGSNPKSKMACIKTEDIESCLHYGALKGLGQWRSGGFGRFTWKLTSNTSPLPNPVVDKAA